jgi:hypothetical protein
VLRSTLFAVAVAAIVGPGAMATEAMAGSSDGQEQDVHFAAYRPVAHHTASVGITAKLGGSTESFGFGWARLYLRAGYCRLGLQLGD